MTLSKISFVPLLMLSWTPLWAQEPAPAVQGLVEAIPFHLDQPYRYDWRKERPSVSSGYILVLDITPFRPKQVAEPVLYVGRQTAERINSAYPSGRLIALVPGNPDDSEARDFIDLVGEPIWFGTPALPEQVDAIKIDAELERARARSITPFAEAEITAAREAGGPTVNVTSKQELIGVLVELVAQYAPDEVDLIRQLRLTP